MGLERMRVHQDDLYEILSDADKGVIVIKSDSGSFVLPEMQLHQFISDLNNVYKSEFGVEYPNYQPPQNVGLR